MAKHQPTTAPEQEEQKPIRPEHLRTQAEAEGQATTALPAEAMRAEEVVVQEAHTEMERQVTTILRGPQALVATAATALLVLAALVVLVVMPESEATALLHGKAEAEEVEAITVQPQVMAQDRVEVGEARNRQEG